MPEEFEFERPAWETKRLPTPEEIAHGIEVEVEEAERADRYGNLGTGSHRLRGFINNSRI